MRDKEGCTCILITQLLGLKILFSKNRKLIFRAYSVKIFNKGIHRTQRRIFRKFRNVQIATNIARSAGLFQSNEVYDYVILKYTS